MSSVPIQYSWSEKNSKTDNLTVSLCRVGELDKLSAADTLDEEQVRQMVFDLESSREAFVRTLG